jgi:HK97 family phage prohead protease
MTIDASPAALRAPAHMRQGLIRSVPFTVTRAEESAGGDGLTLEGYAAVFEQRTEIDSWEGTFVETIRKGAFRKTIRSQTPVMQFDHGRHPVIGSIPIGRIETLSEDDQGLYVRGRLTDNWLIQPVRDAIRDENVTGMSFRFDVVREEWRDNQGKLLKAGELDQLLWNPEERGPLERTLIELRVPELGPVVFPAYAGTSVSVRAAGMAGSILADRELRRDIQRALVADADAELPEDEELREEIALAVLFPERADEHEETSESAPPEGHPDEDLERELEPDAPPEGHPSNSTDAPPAEGHPSPPNREQRQKYARLAYVTRNGVGKRYT